MAPEQVTGRNVGPASDRYSLAVMAYEMLTGTLPFQEGGVLEVMYAQVHMEPAVPSMVNHGLPAKVDAVIMRGMAKEPAARWERCADFVAALEKALNGSVPDAVERTIAFAPPAPQAPPANPRPARRTPAALDATTVMAPDAAAGPIRGPDPQLPSPVITRRGFAVPRQKDTKSRRGGRSWVLWVAIGLIVALLVVAAAFVIVRPLG